MSLIIETKTQQTSYPITDTGSFSSKWNNVFPNFASPEDILKLNNKIADLETNISNIQPTVINNHNTNEGTLNNLQSQISLIKNDFTEFMKATTTIQNTIMNQVTEIQNKEPNTIVNNITKEVTQIDEGRLNNIQQDLQQQTNAISQNITNNLNNINNNATNITNNMNNIQQLQNQNTDVNKNLTNITAQVTDLTKSFETKLTEQNSIIKNLQNNLSNIQQNNSAVYYTHSSTPAFYENYELNKKPEQKYYCVIS
jgi:chromosome segregation ATPase